MGESRREGPLRRALRALAGGAEEARQAAIERTGKRFPDAYPPGCTDREGSEGRERDES